MLYREMAAISLRVGAGAYDAPAAIDDQCLAGDMAGAGAGEEKDRLGDVFRRRRPAHGCQHAPGLFIGRRGK